MVKINSKAMLFLLIVTALVILSGCAKPECKTSADCTSKTCFLSRCEEKKCTYTLQQNCCGNELKESVENGKPGNQCTCPEDYGKCEGNGTIRVGTRTENAEYVHYYCNDKNQCVLGVEQKDVAAQNFLDIIDIGFFKASSVARYNEPFDINKDAFEVKLTLDNVHKDIILPVKLTKLRLLYTSGYGRTEQLIAEKNLDNGLTDIGGQLKVSTPINLGYKLQEVEESGSWRYSIDYTYTKQVVIEKKPDGSNNYAPEAVRATFNSPQKKVLLVKTQ